MDLDPLSPVARTKDSTLPLSVVTDPLRLGALNDLAILDTPAEARFDDVVRLAARLCAAPVALVSLVTDERQWFKARIGFPRCETNLDSSVCQFVLGEPDLLVIPDLAADARTAANPLVTDDPNIRFYAGAPLRLSNGQVVGSLCIIDTEPRPQGLSPEQAEDLRALGRQVSDLLDMRRAVENRDEALRRQQAELRQARRIDVLAKASQALLTAKDPAAVLDPILSANADLLGFDRSYTYDLLPDGRHLRLTHSLNSSEDVQKYLRRMPFGAPLCGIVAEQRRPLVLSNLQMSDDERFQTARGISLDAYAGFPIMSRGSLCGVISFASTKIHAFDEEALTFFQTLARLMSAVYERLDGERALRESDTRSRLAQEAGKVGTFEMDIGSGLINVSPEFARLFGIPATALYSAERIEALVLPEDRALSSSEEARRTGDAALEVAYRIRRADDGALRWIARRATFIRDDAGHVVRMYGTVQDVTERHYAEARRDALLRLGDRLLDQTSLLSVTMAACETLGTMLDVELVGYGDVDPRAETITVQEDWISREGVTLAGTHNFRDFGLYIEDLKRSDTVVVSDCRSDPRTRDHAATLEARCARAFVNMPVMERGRFVSLLYVSTARERKWQDGELAFIRDVATRLRPAIMRVQLDEERDVINQEMSHRLKNMFAMVLSIAGQTLRGVADREPVDAFEQRIHALSSAHDVLLRRSWSAAPAKEVVTSVLAKAGHDDRIDVAGPDLDLGPRATLSLSLMLHELSTNAVKYGALSVPAGRVSVTWHLAGEGEGQEVVFRWAERNGPPVIPPIVDGARKSFGSRLISMGLVGTGGVDLRYPVSGFEATMRAPLIQLQRS